MFVFRITLKYFKKIPILCKAGKLISKIYIFWDKENKNAVSKNTNSA